VTRTNRVCSAYSEKASQTFGSARRRPLRKIVELRLVRRFHQGGGIIYLLARGLNCRIETCPAIGLNFGQTTLRPDQHHRGSYRQLSMAHNTELGSDDQMVDLARARRLFGIHPDPFNP
jgi:hypothetical protein